MGAPQYAGIRTAKRISPAGQGQTLQRDSAGAGAPCVAVVRFVQYGFERFHQARLEQRTGALSQVRPRRCSGHGGLYAR